MKHDLGDRDHEAQGGRPAIDRHRIEQFRIADDLSRPSDPHHFAPAGYDEKKTNIGTLKDVGEGVHPVVSGPIRNSQCAVIQDTHETGSIALRR